MLFIYIFSIFPSFSKCNYNYSYLISLITYKVTLIQRFLDKKIDRSDLEVVKIKLYYIFCSITFLHYPSMIRLGNFFLNSYSQGVCGVFWLKKKKKIFLFLFIFFYFFFFLFFFSI
uniref:Uncharacterized protein n=1 Tax=Cacopsylla melanoneura TaxID=428564 RepID=A0A8D9AL74_9HEMI